MKIIHLSDLHFGTEENRVVDALSNAIRQTAPELVIISGDFTQIASDDEFIKAREFMKALDLPVFCVPGNHDIPRYDLQERFFNPYKRYKEFIHPNLCPVYETDKVVIAGLNSARRILPHWNWANGAISPAQLEHLKSVYSKAGSKKRICVYHHPVQRALNAPLNTIVFGAKAALAAMNNLEVDLVLTGHVHHASITTLGDPRHTTIYLSASTALSSRLREQENGFNIILMEDDQVGIEVWTLQEGLFGLKEKYFHSFVQTEKA